MKRRQFLAGIGAVAVGVGASRPSFGVAEQPLVRLGAIGISFHAVVGSVVQSVLTRLGARVEPSTAPHDVMFDRLGSGEVDLLATAWMPGTHSHLFAPIQDRIESISTIYSDAKLYWSVPEYVPADAVSSIFDLPSRKSWLGWTKRSAPSGRQQACRCALNVQPQNTSSTPSDIELCLAMRGTGSRAFERHMPPSVGWSCRSGSRSS